MRGVAALLVVPLVTAFTLLPTVHAARNDAGRADPSEAAPGETVHLLYSPPPPELLDVAVQRSATCQITSPSGETSPCQADSTLVIAHVSPGTTTYRWDIAAPSQTGTYHVAFQETDLLALPGNAAPAETAFVVAVRGGEEQLTPGSTDTKSGEGTASSSTTLTRVFYYPLTHPLAPVPSRDADAPVKFIATAAASAGSIVMLLVASRFGGGP